MDHGLSDEELIKLVIDSEEFQKADSINCVRNAVRLKLRKVLIDQHIEDSVEVQVRETNVNRHLDLIILKILKDFDGILILPGNKEMVYGSHYFGNKKCDTS